MSFKEPCYCGSPDCPRCYPLTWDEPPSEFCDNCEYLDKCCVEGYPSKNCSKYLDLEAIQDSYKEFEWEKKYR